MPEFIQPESPRTDPSPEIEQRGVLNETVTQEISAQDLPGTQEIVLTSDPLPESGTLEIEKTEPLSEKMTMEEVLNVALLEAKEKNPNWVKVAHLIWDR